ncbi:hypothetical protein ACJMK2_011108 [Sinanodonta woodiana]|uniref:DUF4371 domain-containing protein n=1 Tax=Sinanodonta woodiana TaxID=1069815 RepID=A0ABD3V3W6_SINWO
MERLLKLQGGIDEVLERHIQDEKQRWREILKRIFDVIKHLASQNLAMRGHATLKLVSSYDTVMARHLRNVRENSGSVSNLSHDIQNEILSLLANTVRDKIINEIKEAKYFGILQLAEVIRYVHFDCESGHATVKETLSFVQLDKLNAAGYEEIILPSLEEVGLNFFGCRAQMYDNASVMSGSISGVQTKLREKNPKAGFINCDNHSLNLAGVHAASVDPTLVTFYGTIQELYVFFSVSIAHWKMSEKLELTVKKECDTR